MSEGFALWGPLRQRAASTLRHDTHRSRKAVYLHEKRLSLGGTTLLTLTPPSSRVDQGGPTIDEIRTVSFCYYFWEQSSFSQQSPMNGTWF